MFGSVNMHKCFVSSHCLMISHLSEGGGSKVLHYRYFVVKIDFGR